MPRGSGAHGTVLRHLMPPRCGFSDQQRQIISTLPSGSRIVNHCPDCTGVTISRRTESAGPSDAGAGDRSSVDRLLRPRLRISSAAKLAAVRKLGKRLGADVISIGNHLHCAGVRRSRASLHRNAEMVVSTPDLRRGIVIDAVVDRLRPLAAITPPNHDLRTKVVITDVAVSHGIPDRPQTGNLGRARTHLSPIGSLLRVGRAPDDKPTKQNDRPSDRRQCRGVGKAAFGGSRKNVFDDQDLSKRAS